MGQVQFFVRRGSLSVSEGWGGSLFVKVGNDVFQHCGHICDDVSIAVSHDL